MLLLAGIFQAGTAAAAPLQAPGVRLDVPEPVLRVLGTIAAYSWPWSIALCLPLALLLFPDGHLMLVVWVPSVEAGPLVLILLVIPLVPAAITIAVLRYQLLDIRLVVSRALLYGLLTAGVVGSYLGLVAVADLVLRRGIGFGSSVLATLVIARPGGGTAQVRA